MKTIIVQYWRLLLLTNPVAINAKESKLNFFLLSLPLCHSPNRYYLLTFRVVSPEIEKLYQNQNCRLFISLIAYQNNENSFQMDWLVQQCSIFFRQDPVVYVQYYLEVLLLFNILWGNIGLPFDTFEVCRYLLYQSGPK